MQSLHQQISFELERFSVQKSTLETLFIGGGTPSTVETTLYEPIFTLLKPYLKQNAEITTEANPNSATKAWLKGMYELGVNRLSLGAQSFNSSKLKALNRAHSPQDISQAIHNAKAVGFKHISLDIIYNYKGDTQSLLEQDLQQAFSLPIDHISAYELTIEEHTKFYSTPEVRQEDNALAYYVANTIEAQGFKQYEISNFGTYQSKHNLGYWEQKNYIGAGSGAVGFLDDTRFYTNNSIEEYIQNPLSIKEESLSANDLLTEAIFLGLRSNVGIKKSILSSAMLSRASFLVSQEKLEVSSTHFYNPNYFLADELSLYILD